MSTGHQKFSGVSKEFSDNGAEAQRESKGKKRAAGEWARN
jgi:hypothetical protein